MTLAVPGLRGMFSLLQRALDPDKPRVTLSLALHDFLDDIRWLHSHLQSRPTYIRETYPGPVQVVGACDASAAGMGGVYFRRTRNGATESSLWREPFSTTTQQSVISYSNPHGSLTNSDLELAGTIAQHAVIAAQDLPAPACIFTATDNTPALAWQRKGSTSTTGPAAYLLRLQALHQRHYGYTAQHAHIPGRCNGMADDASRRWDLTNSQLLAHFDSTYPQATPWTWRDLPRGMLSSLTSALQKHRPAPESFLPRETPRIARGSNGPNFAATCTWIPFSRKSITPLRSSKYTPIEYVKELVPKVVNPSGLELLIPPFVKWARRAPYWGPQTLA